jgi:hypothetical protein
MDRLYGQKMHGKNIKQGVEIQKKIIIISRLESNLQIVMHTLSKVLVSVKSDHFHDTPF